MIDIDQDQGQIQTPEIKIDADIDETVVIEGNEVHHRGQETDQVDTEDDMTAVTQEIQNRAAKAHTMTTIVEGSMNTEVQSTQGEIEEGMKESVQVDMIDMKAMKETDAIVVEIREVGNMIVWPHILTFKERIPTIQVLEKVEIMLMKMAMTCSGMDSNGSRDRDMSIRNKSK